MKALLPLLLLLAGAARAQAPDSTVIDWHVGESRQAAIEHILAYPGWNYNPKNARELYFTSRDRRKTIGLVVVDDKVIAAVYAMPEGSSWGGHIRKGLVPRDVSHWTSPTKKLLFTRQYTEGAETYKVERLP